MKCKSLRFLCAFMTAILVLISGVAVTAYTAEFDATVTAQETLEYKIKAEGASGVQDFIDGWMTENAGTGSPEWYALCLAGDGGYDFSSYISALEPKINASGQKATARQRMALAYHAAGGNNLDTGALIDETWNGLGIMSEIYALILINSGDFSYSTNESEIVSSLLSRQNEDGGWSLSGNVSDPDVTAMALQALSAYRRNSGISNRIDCAVNLLSSMQMSDGGYRSYGTPSSESCAQVIIALCQLGIDPQTDSRFIKNGNSPLSALMSYRCSSGGFAHISGGTENNIATVQAYEALTAVSRGGLYSLTEKSIDISVPALDGDTEIPAEPDLTGDTDSSEPNESSADSGSNPKPSAGNSQSTSALVTSENEQPANNAQAAEHAGEVSGDDFSQESSDSMVTEVNDTVTSSSQTGTSITQNTAAADTDSYASQTETSAAEKTEIVSEASGSTSSVVSVSGTDSESGGDGWKVYAYVTIAGILIFSQVYLVARKQFTVKKLVVSAAVCSVCAGAVFFVRIQSPEEYYSRNIDDIQQDSLTVTLSVSCDTIKDRLDGDCMLVPETELVLLEGDSAFDVLERVLAYEHIPFDYTGNTDLDIYVSGIGGIYEMDYGEMSGWMYRVNGEFPDVGCGAYELEDGDCVEFVYTCDIGRDLGAEVQSE